MELLNIDDVRNLILESGKKEDNVICSMVYKFAKNLPYSMDYQDENFILGEFINLIPNHSDKYLFKDYGNIYNKMINWGDTLVSGIQLQVCNIFQKLLMTNIPENYILAEEDFYNYGFDRLTSMEYYNKSIFNLLKKLPEYCNFVNSAETTEERRSKLEEVYGYICQVTNYVIKNSKKKVVTDKVIIDDELKGFYHRWKPAQDLEMMYFFERIKNYDGNYNILINYIKNNISYKKERIKLVKKLEENK